LFAYFFVLKSVNETFFVYPKLPGNGRQGRVNSVNLGVIGVTSLISDIYFVRKGEAESYFELVNPDELLYLFSTRFLAIEIPNFC